MSKSPPKKDTHIEVRFSFPVDVHKKIKSHQRKLSATKDLDTTMEQALIDFIRNAELTS